MKKLLLLAAMAAMALGASAQEYKIEKVWEINDLSGITPAVNDARQAFGMNGKFYINIKTNDADTGEVPTVIEVDENGLTGTTFEGGLNCGITRDQAGNIIVSNASFPSAWVGASIKVINPETGEVVTYAIPEECGMTADAGRCDFIGFAKGNLFEEGEIYFVAGGVTDIAFPGIARMKITGGEVDADNSYMATIDGVTPSNQTLLNYYTDLNGEEAILYITRNAPPQKVAFNGDNFTGTVFTLPNKGACNGAFPFIFDGKELVVYPTLPNYQNGFAVAEMNAEAPLVEVTSTVAANANGFQCNWVNAEVDADGVTIYQYYPGGHLTVWRMTKVEAAPDVYILGEVNEQSWAPNAGTLMTYDEANNIYTATVHLDGRGESGENYFSFTTELAENNDQGGWDYIAPYRFGAVSEGDFWVSDEQMGQELGLTYENGQSYRVMAGDYKLTVNLETMKLIIEKVAPASLRGDVDANGNVDISDVTALIDYLLSGNAEGVDTVAADCDLNENVDISDVTALIDYLLSGAW